MRTFLTMLLSLLSLSGFAGRSTFDKLCEVNKCWRDQQDVDRNQRDIGTPMTETAWIRLHLSMVEQTLRSRATNHLTAQQTQNRELCLDHLNDYWKAGKFPQNEAYSYRTPIFIDRYDNFCAVGYLVKASGNEPVSRMIAAKTNLAYVKEMNYPELNQWASDFGFTVDELAWIQPGYSPLNYADAVGKGVEGEVKTLFADNSQNIMYVGGTFPKADSTLPVNNIAYVTGQAGSYTWHAMGTGVNGTVNAIVKHDNKIFVAGAFTEAGGVAANNVAYWDGSAWHNAGCTYGTINSLVVFNGELYAAGNFDVCAAMNNINFARWDGTAWLQLPGLTGQVNTMFVHAGSLVLGGAFSYNNDDLNIIRWNKVSGFAPYTNKISNEVKDIKLLGDTVYAVCKKTHSTDTLSLLVQLKGDTWRALDPNPVYSLSAAGSNVLSLNTLCVLNNNTLMLGGSFNYSAVIGYWGYNCVNITPRTGFGSGRWFAVDDAINTMVIFNGELIAGGKFKYGNGYIGTPHSVPKLNGITRQATAPNSVPKLPVENRMTIYPNPVKHAGAITVENNFEARHFVVSDLTGRVLQRGKTDAKPVSEIRLSAAVNGVYMLELANDNGVRVVQKIVVE